MNAAYRRGCLASAAIAAAGIVFAGLVAPIVDVSPLWPALGVVGGAALYDWQMLRRGE